MAATATLPRAIVDLDEFTESINLMIYGDTGVGKTELISYLPGRVLVLSSENGTIVIKRMMKRLGISQKEAKRFKVWPIRKWQDLEEAYIWVRDHGIKVFDWIAIDTATSVQGRAMRAAMEKAVAHNPVKRDIDLPDRGEHQKMQNAMKRMVADFNELPINTFWLAQAMRREDRDGNEIVLPFIMGKDFEVSSWVCAQMQAFAYYAKRPAKVEIDGRRGKRVAKTVTQRVLIWDSFADSEDVTYWAKDRYQIMEPYTVMATGEKQETTFDELITAIMNSGSENLQRASELREKDVRNARTWRGETEPEEDTDSDDNDDETEQETEATDGDTDDDDDNEESDAEEAAEDDEPLVTRKAAKAAAKRGGAAKKATARKSQRTTRFRASSEDED